MSSTTPIQRRGGVNPTVANSGSNNTAATNNTNTGSGTNISINTNNNNNNNNNNINTNRGSGTTSPSLSHLPSSPGNLQMHFNRGAGGGGVAGGGGGMGTTSTSFDQWDRQLQEQSHGPSTTTTPGANRRTPVSGTGGGGGNKGTPVSANVTIPVSSSPNTLAALPATTTNTSPPPPSSGSVVNNNVANSNSPNVIASPTQQPQTPLLGSNAAAASGNTDGDVKTFVRQQMIRAAVAAMWQCDLQVSPALLNFRGSSDTDLHEMFDNISYQLDHHLPGGASVFHQQLQQQQQQQQGSVAAAAAHSQTNNIKQHPSSHFVGGTRSGGPTGTHSRTPSNPSAGGGVIAPSSGSLHHPFSTAPNPVQQREWNQLSSMPSHPSRSQGARPLSTGLLDREILTFDHQGSFGVAAPTVDNTTTTATTLQHQVSSSGAGGVRGTATTSRPHAPVSNYASLPRDPNYLNRTPQVTSSGQPSPMPLNIRTASQGKTPTMMNNVVGSPTVVTTSTAAAAAVVTSPNNSGIRKPNIINVANRSEQQEQQLQFVDPESNNESSPSGSSSSAPTTVAGVTTTTTRMMNNNGNNANNQSVGSNNSSSSNGFTTAVKPTPHRLPYDPKLFPHSLLEDANIANVRRHVVARSVSSAFSQHSTASTNTNKNTPKHSNSNGARGNNVSSSMEMEA